MGAWVANRHDSEGAAAEPHSGIKGIKHFEITIECGKVVLTSGIQKGG